MKLIVSAYLDSFLFHAYAIRVFESVQWFISDFVFVFFFYPHFSTVWNCVACDFCIGNQCWWGGKIDGWQINHKCRRISKRKAWNSFSHILSAICLSQPSCCASRCPNYSPLSTDNSSSICCDARRSRSNRFTPCHFACTDCGRASLQTTLNSFNKSNSI